MSRSRAGQKPWSTIYREQRDAAEAKYQRAVRMMLILREVLPMMDQRTLVDEFIKDNPARVGARG